MLLIKNDLFCATLQWFITDVLWCLGVVPQILVEGIVKLFKFKKSIYMYLTIPLVNQSYIHKMHQNFQRLFKGILVDPNGENC